MSNNLQTVLLKTTEAETLLTCAKHCADKIDLEKDSKLYLLGVIANVTAQIHIERG